MKRPLPLFQGEKSDRIARALTFHAAVRILGRTKAGKAEVAELVDAPDSGSGPGNRVEVRVLSSAL